MYLVSSMDIPSLELYKQRKSIVTHIHSSISELLRVYKYSRVPDDTAWACVPKVCSLSSSIIRAYSPACHLLKVVKSTS
jgi:hypothetical protein